LIVTIDEFSTEAERLVRVFGEKSFNAEFLTLAYIEVKEMPIAIFRKTVNSWIGERLPHQAPRTKDFREEFYNWKKNQARVDNGQAWRQINNKQSGNKLDPFGCKTIDELLNKKSNQGLKKMYTKIMK